MPSYCNLTHLDFEVVKCRKIITGFHSFFNNLTMQLVTWICRNRNIHVHACTITQFSRCHFGVRCQTYCINKISCTTQCCFTGGSLEPAVASLESLQGCYDFLWNSAGLEAFTGYITVLICVTTVIIIINNEPVQNINPSQN